MSAVLPAPSMMVVLSLSMVTLLGLAELVELDVFKLDAEVLEDGLAAGQNGDILQHGFAAVAKAGGLDGTDLQHAAELVDHQCRQGFAFDVFGDDQQRPAVLGNLFENRDQRLDGADFLFVDQNVRFIEIAGAFSRGC